MQNNFSKISFVLSLAFFCASLFAFLFLYGVINRINEKSHLAEAKWQEEANRRDDIKALDRSMKNIEAERAELETHFAQSSDIVPFLDTIEGLAPKVGVSAEVSSVDILKDSTGLLVGMKASGSFSGLYKFITLLENSPYELEFKRMDLRRETGVEENSSKWSLSLNIKLLSFVQ